MAALTPGGNVALTAGRPGLHRVRVGLGWSIPTQGPTFDLDASVFLVQGNGLVRSDQDFVYYNNLSDADGCVVHGGDSLDGEGNGDDETVSIFLDRVPDTVQKVVIGATIHEAQEQTFDLIEDAYIRLIDADGGDELLRFDLPQDFGGASAMLFGEVYRHNGEWKFRALGMGFTGGLAMMAISHGLDIRADR